MSKNKETQLIVLSLNGNNIGYSDRQDIVSKKSFESIITSIKKNFFHQRMMIFINNLELSDKNHRNNGNGRDEHYKRKFLISMKDFVSFATYHQSIYFVSNRFSKDNIDGVCVP